MSFTCTLFSDKGRCFNQSECALYGNFIIIIDNITTHKLKYFESKYEEYIYFSKVLLDPIYWKDIPLSVRNKPTRKLFKKCSLAY